MKELRQFMKAGDSEYLYDKDGNLYIKRKQELSRLCLFDKHYYNLRLFSGVPVLEIDGLRMQLVRDFNTPLDYAREVVDALRIKKTDAVLDTCMGLGYTALEAAKYAKSVLTYEISEAVLTLARFNPIGGKLFETRNVKVEQGNIAERISELPDRSIDVIIHDPPRFSLAPELYSTGFYEQMKRVLKANGRLFHYTGSVGHKRKRDIASEISGRMKAMGFRTRKIERLQGLVATMTTF